MAPEMQQLALSIGAGAVPSLWEEQGIPATMPLLSWSRELAARARFWGSWANKGRPNSMWLTAFAFPRAFVVALCRRGAVRFKASIEDVSLEFEVLDSTSWSCEDQPKKPVEGCHVHGFFLEGCRWDSKNQSLAPLQSKELMNPLPLVWFRPVIAKQRDQNGQRAVYKVPTYRTAFKLAIPHRLRQNQCRRESGSVVDIELPSKTNPEVWALAGVTLLLSLG